MKRKLTILLLFLASFSFAQDGLLFVDGGLVYNEGFQTYLPVPHENLTAKFDTAYVNSSGDLLNMAGGANAVYVSGTDTGAIYDFSGLNDDRLNKNAYLGNSSGLDEYYNYPYDSIYFDTSNPYYWKLKDFHRYYLEDQILDETLNDCFFLKASATSNTSNVLDEVSGLVVYSTPLADSNLSKTLSWIGIQADFYGDEKTTDWNLSTFWDLINTNWSFNEGINIISNGVSGLIGKANIFPIRISFKVIYSISVNSGSIYGPYNGTNPQNIGDSTGTYEYIYVSDDSSTAMYINSNNFNGSLTYLSIRQVYQNYYKQ